MDIDRSTLVIIYIYMYVLECSRRYPSTMTVLMDITFRWHCRKLHLFFIPWPGQVLLAGQEQLAGRRHPAGAPGRKEAIGKAKASGRAEVLGKAGTPGSAQATGRAAAMSRSGVIGMLGRLER